MARPLHGGPAMSTQPLELNVTKFMTQDVETCTGDDVVGDVLQAMRARGVRFLPVIGEGGRVVGVVTRSSCEEAARVGSDKALKVWSVMSWAPCVCGPDDDIEAAEQLMRRHHVRRLPVVDREGVLCGVLSLSDIRRSQRWGAEL